MPARTYMLLPLETLYEFLVVAVRDMFIAQESNKEDSKAAYVALKKQVEILLDVIEEKRKPPIKDGSSETKA